MNNIKVKDLLLHQNSNSDISCDHNLSRVLRGVIKTTPSDDYHYLHQHHCLYFVDDTGCISCQLESNDLKLSILTGEVQIRKWNLINHNRGVAILQIIEPLLTGQASVANEDRGTLDVITVKQARIIQHNREKCRAKNFTVFGTIEYLSEIKRIKKDMVFLVTFSDLEKQHFIDVLIKRPEFLHWQKFISPGERIIVSHLQPTTLYKGEKSKEAKLFVVTSESQLYYQDDVDIKYLDLKDLLHDNLPGTDILTQQLLADNRSSSLISYQGTITKVRHLQKQIYDLDNKVRLILTFLSSDLGSMLTVGTEVILYNVHHRKSNDVLHLYGCHRSCVKISKFAYPQKRYQEAYKTTQFLCTIKPRSLSDLENQVALEAELGEKFSTANVPQQTADFLYKCMNVGGEDDSNSRQCQSSVTQYLHHDICPVQTNVWLDSRKEVITFAKLLKCLELIRGDSKCGTTDETSMTGYHGNRSQHLTDKSSWSFASKRYDVEPCNGWLICGVLGINEHTSLVELQDKTGAIHCVVAPDGCDIHQQDDYSDDRKSAKHSGLLYKCHHHFVCPNVRGRLLFVRRYQIVTEEFIVNKCAASHLVDDSKDTEQTYVNYLVFSMRDAFVCHKGQSLTGHTFLSSKLANSSSRKRRLQEPDIAQENVVLYKQLFQLITRDTLRVEQHTASDVSLTFYALVEFMGSVKQESVNQCTRVDQKVCNHDVEDMQHDSDTGTPSNQSSRVILYFVGEMASWFSFLHPGCLYWLEKKSAMFTSASENNIFFTHKLPDNVLHSVIKTKAVRYIKMDPTISISMKSMRIPDQSIFRMIPEQDESCDFSEQIITVSNLLNEKCSNLVTVVGRIQSRQLVMSPWQHKTSERYRGNMETVNKKLGLSVPDSKNLLFVLQDTENPSHSVNIYWHSGKLSFPLGLLPGAVVVFYKMELKHSKSDRIYVNYLMTSSHWIVKLPQVRELSVRDRPDFVDCKLMLFCEMWVSGGASRAQAACLVICHIQQVLDLSIHALCVKCGSLWVKDSCSSERCLNTSYPNIQAKARCTVDDGTGTAIVFYNSKSTTAALLTLGDEQWHALEQEVLKCGLVTLSPGTNSTNPLACFLSDLLTSNRVKRSVTMIVKRFRMFRTPTGDKYSSIHDFRTNDFPLKKLDFGPTYKTLETRTLPWLQLECLQLKENSSLDLYKYYNSSL